jgi:hypothetical protein
LNGSRLKPSLRQARKGVCCVRTTAMVLALTLMTLPAAAQSCREWGNQTTCYGGPTVNHYGNSSNPRGGYGAQAPSNPATVSRGNSGATAPAFGSGPIAQPGCSEWGNQTTCYGGPTVNHYGNSSNPRGGYVPYQPPSQPPSGGAGGATVSRTIPGAFGSGPTAVPDGTPVLLPDGRTATRQGSTTTFSDGRTCQHSGSAMQPGCSEIVDRVLSGRRRTESPAGGKVQGDPSEKGQSGNARGNPGGNAQGNPGRGNAQGNPSQGSSRNAR